MASDALLSTLCSICYTAEHKYRCPRCSTQTCSLPCYKRHKQRASCSGQRDPAAFKSKARLNTPTAIDQDYNYLRSLEQNLDLAAEAANPTADDDDSIKVRNRALHPESTLQKYLARHSILVDRAPLGMSRQKTNRTRTTKRLNLFWTVEWVDAHGLRQIQDDCLESSTIAELYAASHKERHESGKRKKASISEAETTSDDFEPEEVSLKRRRGNTILEQTAADAANFDNERSQQSSQEEQGETNEVDAVTPKSGQHPPDCSSNLTPTTSASNPSNITIASQIRPAVESTSEQNKPVAISSIEPAFLLPAPHFYLLKPGTQTSRIILIPLEADMSLTRNLSGRTILEYPTIYALPQGPTSLLHTKFQLESDYHSTLTQSMTKVDATHESQASSLNSTSPQAALSIEPKTGPVPHHQARSVTRDSTPAWPSSRTLSPFSPAPSNRSRPQSRPYEPNRSKAPPVRYTAVPPPASVQHPDAKRILDMLRRDTSR